MPLYEVYKVINGGDVLSKILNDEKIEHSKFFEFSVKNEMSRVHFEGKDTILSIFYPPESNKM
jgi:hypothetical protein